MMEPLLSLQGIGKTFRDSEHECEALRDITIDAVPGEILCIMGPSGCGKSTLIRIIAGLETSDTGKISILGKPDPGITGTAMVFQEDALFPWLNIRNNIRYGMTLGNLQVPGAEADKRVESLLELMRLEDFASFFPYQLSGGMKQRAAVARALAVKPGILLMDEPFSALDPFTRRELQDEVIRIRDAASADGHPISILMVTHNPEEAVYLADRIIVLSERPGKIVGIFDVPLRHPRSISSGEFLSIREQVTGLVHH